MKGVAKARLQSLTQASHRASSTDYSQSIHGVAIFDANGLPREYFTTAETQRMDWVQTVFQALGLKSLLMSSLQVDGFQSVAIRMTTSCSVVFKQRDRYIALLMLEPDWKLPPAEYEQFVTWLDEFERNQLRQHDRFTLV